MANFSVVPSALTFSPTVVQGPYPGLYPAAPTATFVLYNTSGASVTITNYGFSNSTEGDAITQPAGIYSNSDFTVVPTAGTFPVTVANNASQSFTVTYAPLRRGSGFGDVRSAILVLYAGSIALSNGGQTTNSSGEVINLGLPKVLTIGVGGGVIEEGYDWATVAPILRNTGKLSDMSVSGTGEVSLGYGVSTNMTIADIDSGRHSLSAIELFSGIAAGTSAVGGVAVGARGVQVLVYGLDTASYIDLTISAVTFTGNVTVGSWTDLTYENVGGLFIGNAEGVDLQGLNLYASVANVTNPNNNTIKVGVVVTG
jgi:hypothetical protein